MGKFFAPNAPWGAEGEVEEASGGSTHAPRSGSGARRGHRLLLTIAKIEIAMSGLEPVDRLLALNTALENVLHDARAGVRDAE